ncbi:MAG: hypothetical protein IJ383_07575 [Bacteroidales bacterium]|nr:hypothetical protein [Bacteroidales bacterium]
MNDHLVLEICRVNLQNALDSNKRNEMISSLKYVSKFLPYSVLYNGEIETRVIIYGKGGIPTRLPFEMLDLENARCNVLGYINAIDKEFSFVQYNLYSASYPRHILFEKGDVFKHGDVLFERSADVLSVADLLQVCGYAVKVAEMIEPGHKLFDEAGAAVSVFKGLELVLNNKGKNNQCAKMLHLANDFLLRAVKPDLEKKEHKQVVVGLSLLVDLAIDFLSGK